MNLKEGDLVEFLSTWSDYKSTLVYGHSTYQFSSGDLGIVVEIREAYRGCHPMQVIFGILHQKTLNVVWANSWEVEFFLKSFEPFSEPIRTSTIKTPK